MHAGGQRVPGLLATLSALSACAATKPGPGGGKVDAVRTTKAEKK